MNMQRPTVDPIILDTYEIIDSPISELIEELQFIRKAYLNTYPESYKISNNIHAQDKSTKTKNL
jgi:hypothetical protein